MLLLHDEVDDAAPPLAAEAVVDLLVRGDAHGWRMVVMKRTDTKIFFSLFFERDIPLNDRNDIGLIQNITKILFRNLHETQ